MGVGARKLINITYQGEQQGTDSLEGKTDLIKQVYAEYKEIGVGQVFTGQQPATGRSYEFLIDYDSQLPIDFGNGLEYDNKQFTIKAIDRGHRQNVSNYSYRFIPAEDGRYMRLLCEGESNG